MATEVHPALNVDLAKEAIDEIATILKVPVI